MTITSILVDSLAMPSEARQREVRKVFGCWGGGTTEWGRPRRVGSRRPVWQPEHLSRWTLAHPGLPPSVSPWPIPAATPMTSVTKYLGNSVMGGELMQSLLWVSTAAQRTVSSHSSEHLAWAHVEDSSLSLIHVHTYWCKAKSPSGHHTKGKQSSPEFFSCGDKMWDE